MESLLGLARGNYIIALDHPETGAAEASQRFYKEAYERAGDIGDQRGMIRALVPTLWFTDFWPDYESQARANAEEALALSQSIADKELEIEAELAMFYTDPLLERIERGERLRAQLESAGDLARLNYLLFGLMGCALAIGEFEQAVAHCDRGIELADRLGVPPVQYPTLKSIALARLGRFNEALDSLEQEIADESHKLASAFKELGRAIIYFELQAFRPAAELLLDLIQPAKELARVWMQDSIHLYLTRVVLEGGLLDEIDLQPSLSYLKGVDSAQAAVALGELALAEKDQKSALSQANRALDMAAASSGRQPQVSMMALELKALVLLLDRQAEQALQAADDGIVASKRMGYRPMLWRLMGTRADALDALGRKDEAQDERQHAAQLIEQLAKDIADESLREIFLESAAVRSIFAKQDG
jgi:tetratricopeptide (TPR) repeat protein